MQRITLIVLLTLFLPDLYIYLAHLRHCGGKRWLRLLHWLPSILLAGIYLYYIALSGENTLSHHAQGIGRLAIATLLFGASKVAFMLCSLAGVLVHALMRRCPRLPFNVAGMLLGATIFGCTLYGATIGVERVEVKEVPLHLSNLPEGFRGYRVVQLSDLHVGSWKGHPEVMEKMVEKVNALQPDLILFTGDLVNQRSDELPEFAPILSRLKAKDGVYSVLGNHDYGDYYRWPSPQDKADNMESLLKQQADMGWHLLNNEHVLLYRGGDTIVLAGVENDGEPPFSQHADLQRTMQGTDGRFCILMSHNPTHWRREVLPHGGIDLMLAGHTHAMQSQLFGRSLAALKYPEWSGLYREEGRMLYVNVGIGYVGLPFRFGAWPEITLFTLQE
ncbi:MAG: metallophosphoesterase [Bacteroides sp.]|nr:metallophosphoesterase [Bacteroides sp.]